MPDERALSIEARELADVWTPKMVRECLVEAIRWARYHAGPTGPAAVRSTFPAFVAGPEDFEAEGWGIRESADDPTEPPPTRRRLSPREVSQLTDALFWTTRYVIAELPTSALVLNLWLRCKVYRRNFDDAIASRQEMSRASAYRYRDRATAAIAMGLTRDGVEPW
ncbi:hypothetical protein [Kaistia sp. MMO-174]|uniref:hypothetical protein n=1 Tax=Kaistia sp. MMO-174 TaxID=3081256 RepID=UPI003015F135